MRKLLIFCFVSASVFGQRIGLINQDTTTLPKQKMAALAEQDGSLRLILPTGVTKRIPSFGDLTGQNIQQSPSYRFVNDTEKSRWNANKIAQNVSELKALAGVAGDKAELLGYYSQGDGGGQQLYWNATSTKNDNGGTVFQVSGVSIGRWESINNSFVNIKQFGAKVDGITNDSISIQKALDCPYSCFFPDGIVLTSGNTITTSSKKIYSSANAIIKLKNNSYRCILNVVNVENVTISDIQFDGNADGNILDNGLYTISGINNGITQETATLLFDNCNNVKALNVKVLDSFCSPIVLKNCRNSSIEKCYSLNHRREGFGIAGGEKNKIINCLSECNGSILSWSCIFTKGLNYNYPKPFHQIIGNEAINSQTAFLTINTNYTEVINNTIRKTASISTVSGPGIRLGHQDTGADSTLRAHYCTIKNNKIYDIQSNLPYLGEPGGRAISLDNASNSLVESNEIHNCRNGIGVSVVSQKNIIIQKNTLYNISNIGIEAYNSDNVTVVSNIIDAVSKGIRISAQGTTIDNNTITNNSNTGIELYYSAPIGISNTRIINNYVNNSTGSKYVIASRASMYVQNNIGLDGLDPNYVVYADAAPTTGYWAKGNTVYNSKPNSTSSVGWICTASGTPGTWHVFGNINNYTPKNLVNTTVDTGENLQVTGNAIIKTGTIEISDLTKGIILKSPNGTRWLIKVNNSGVLTTTAQ